MVRKINPQITQITRTENQKLRNNPQITQITRTENQKLRNNPQITQITQIISLTKRTKNAIFILVRGD